MHVKYTNYKLEAGCDEAGRGCLAGPVVAAAVILPDFFNHPLLNDSKQVTKKNRDVLRHYIEEHALFWDVAFIEAQIIDEINILNASFLAMETAVSKLNVVPEFLLIDGNRFKSKLNIPFKCMVKGDARFSNIAAASILAKTYRDEYMEKIALEFPDYGWQQNAGYPTKSHRQAIEKYGITPYHRKTFRLLDSQTSLNL